jgi:anti-anti-sigma factor
MRTFIKLRKDSTNAVKLITGDFAWPSVENIDKQLFSFVQERGWRKLTLDLGDVEYLTGAALGKLVALREELKAVGKQLTLDHVSLDVYELFRVTQLSTIFDIRSKPRAASV